ncbi:virion RNA polymerase [Escherichia phage vB_EcoP_PhAPEC7]|uniref:Putative virion RNA polymerase n=1 Tax=Escherichia phage vB_EcoP_PhAPEC7 TaxID=1391223 RepID=A0A067ZIS8_9CAUD|nr:virion RNA polymerase [Escherichia phage vB_EcoP_PhAPEC7]AHV82680.1 putative virion RNA polymerase [Escherichia phage vB_EcoP_PhAPEC7]
MSTFDRLAGFADSITNAKQVDVSTATSQKQAAQGQSPFQLTPENAYNLQTGRVGNLGIGAFEPGSLQADFTQASPLEIINKYGNEQGLQILNSRANAADVVRQDLSKQRTNAEAFGDTLSGVGLGVANTLGGIAALGTGLVNDNAGASIASGMDWLNEGVHNLQSDALNATRKVVQNQNQISAQKNQKLYEQDVKNGESDLVASLSRIGRDAFDSVANTLDNGMAASDGLSEGVGSLFTGGPLIRGVSALGKVMVGGDKAVKGITLAAGLGSRPAQVALSAGRVVAPAIAIGGMEAGGAYQQTASEIMKMSHQELASKSPVYQQHIADGLSPDEARRQTASETGITAAGLTAPVAAATGPLVSRFELNPLKVGSLAGAGSNMLRETVEEGIQSGFGQFAQNTAIKENVDASRDTLKGVGEQAGLGALYGFGSAGVAQAPGATVKAAGAAAGPTLRTTLAGASLVGKTLAKATSPLTNILVQRGEEVAKRNEQASPVADATVNAAAQEAAAQAEQAQATVQEAVDAMDITPEEKAAATQYAADLTQAMKFDPVELEQVNPVIREAVSGSTNRVEAIQKMADLVNTAEDPNVQMEAAIQMYDNIMSMDNFINRDPGALANLEQGSPAAAIVDQFSGLMANVQNTPKVLRAFRAIHSMIQEQAEAGKLKATEEANQAQANNIAMAADVSPEVLDADSVNMVLKHASEGKITLGNRQRAALQSAAALLQGAREFDAKAEELGLRPQDIVSKQIKTDESRSNEGQYSALQHAKRIRSAYNSGNFDLASAYLSDFMKFAQHMQNKVGALNEHLISGNADKNKSVHYQALSPSREWVRSRTGLGVNPYDTKSVKFAQQVGLEAKTVADIANALATAYPELNVSHVKVTSLDSRLNKPVAQVVKEFRQGGLDATQSQQTNEPVNQVDETPAPVQEDTTTVQPKAKPVVENKTAPTKETSPKAEEVSTTKPETVEATLTNEDTIQEVAETKTEMETVFPVYNNEKTPNQFLKAFTLPEEPKSRTIGSESPLADIKQALSSAARFEAFTQKENNALTSDVMKRYQDLMDFGETLKTTLSERLVKFLANKNVGKRFAEGTEANRWVGGKLLNIVERDGDTFKFNDQLLETAVLAGLQWRLTATQNAAIKDMKDVAAITGVEASLLPEGILAEFENAQTLVEATNSLAQKIESYWGLNRNPNAPLGYTKGIPMAMATEILSSLIEMGEVKESMLDVSEIDPDSNKTVGLYTIEKLDDNDAINKFPTAIEEAVLLEPEEKMYFGDDIPSVAQTQLRNPAVKNTPEQKAALKAEQATEFRVHMPMVNFYEALGRDNILELMGAGSLNPELLNMNTAKSLEGKNLSVSMAYDSLFGVISQIREQENGLDTPIHYGYNMTRVGRMQMLGKNNPQSSKLVREAILPTFSTIDLSNENSQAVSDFQLGLAQALGIKVHNMSREAMSEKLTKALEGNLKPAVDMMVEFDKSGHLPADAVDILKTSLGGDKSFVALMALMEYARYLNSDDRANFTTPLYVEADGVTNGPINAMVLMTGGKFTPDWIKNTAKGGLFFGKAGKTMNEHRSQDDSVDLYEASTNGLQQALNELRTTYRNNVPVMSQMNHLQKLMDLFIKDFNLNEDGTLDLKRGIAKNPLTITIYGSGARGIAGKMVSAITDTIYERFSDVLQARAADPSISPAMAMFGKEAASEADAQAMLDTFLTSMEALTGNVPVMRKGELSIQQVDGALTGKLDPQKFTVSGNALKNLQENMLHLFVEPMRTGIRNTVGEGLMHSTENLQKATQIQSLVLQDMFQQAVQTKLAEKEKDPTWKKGDFLTQKELNEIQESLSPLAPMIETGSQTFYIAGSENTDVANQVLATNLDDRMRVPMSIYAPSQAGVAGIPFMTIGTGDGMMMQTLSTMKGAPKNTLKIFDGMNIGINDITDASRKANEAVYTSWQGNPIKNVYDSYAKFMKNVDFSKLSDETKQAIAKSALEYDQREGATDDLLRAGAEQIERNLRNIALGVDIRHKVMNQVQTTVDQMAAVGAPYVNNGKISLEGLTVDQQVAKLNELFDAELNKRRNAVRAAKAEPVKEVPAMEQVGRVLKSGVRLLSNTAISKLAKEMTPEQQAVLKEVQKSLAAKDYKVVYGTPAQLDAYAIEKNITRPAPKDIEAAEAGNAYGWTNFDDKTIYLVTSSLETLVHELVHASTFESVLAHYEGTPNEAIQNIEDLMNQFRTLDVKNESPAVREAYADALNTINGHLSNGFIEPAMAKAAALNEYMAWGLTNRELIGKQKKTTALKTMVQSVYEAIKRLVFGRKKAPANADDMFSGLLFNSSVVMRGQAPTAAVSKDTTLFHNKAYGDNTRLEELGQTFDKLIINYIGSEPVQQVIRKGKFSDAVVNATKVTRDVQAHGFTMNMQEQRLFTNIVAALATEAAISPAALSRAQEYYAHVTKNLTVESFMADPDSTNPADRYYAQQKFDTIMGANNIEFDAQGRSSLLPTFVGLAMVSEEVRNVLANIPVMKADKKSGNTVDAMLTNIGTAAMSSLNARVAGDTKATNVQEGMDALAQTIMQTSLNAQSFYDSVATPSGNAIDRANQYLVDSIDALSTRALESAREVAANTKNPLVKGAAHAAQLVAAIATEKNGAIVAEGVMAAMNQGKVWQPFHDLINDLTGRTKSNASVYDLIKAVRAQVQADRQQFREHLPTTIASKFSRKLTNDEWKAMHTGMGKTDLAVLRDTMSLAEIRDLLSDQKIVDREVNKLEADLQKQAGRNWPLINRKSKQLAQYMINGTVGNNLLRNATAISRMLGERQAARSTVDVAQLDKLITLYALEAMNKSDREMLSSLAQTEVDGMDFATSYLVGQRKDEMAKAKSDMRATLNQYKGHIPSENKQGVNLIVAEDNQFADLIEKSYVRLGTYQGSSANRGPARSYYFAPVQAQAPFSQGILQNVRDTAGGVDLGTGFTMGSMVAGRITDKPSVDRITKALARGERGNEPLLPVYDDKGNVVAYEQSIDPNMLKHIEGENHLARAIGIWRGRQVEEAKAQRFNDMLIENLHSMYENDIKMSASNKSQYVNLLGSKLDPVTADALKLMNSETRQKAESLFGEGELWVRRDMLNDALGYRAASVGDAWSGNSRWSPETLDTFKKAMLGVFGNRAYKYTMGGENLVQNLVKEAKTLIVVKSVVVPAVNFLANLYQMVARGVPVKNIAKSIPQKTAEINQYLKSRLRQVDAEAELRAATNPNQIRKLKAEIQSITDSHKRMSIWPLLEAGEFSSIADAGIGRDDILITEGKLHEYMEKLADKLPKSVRTAGRYALITKDTALFQGIQKTVEYSDFIAKAIIYDELTQRKGKTREEALGRVTEEFINYDRLPGRFRGYMESVGLMWFYNFKIRSAKVAVSMIRNNPVHAAMAMLAPTPTMFGNVGLPIQDNIFSIAAKGGLDYSWGFGQGLRAHNLNPWMNLVN